YETAISNAFRGDAFYKIRWGQRWGGALSKDLDPFRIFIEAQNPEYVFPEVSPVDANQIIAYHIAFPQLVDTGDGERWVLNIESHYPGRIVYRRMTMSEINTNFDNEVRINLRHGHPAINDSTGIMRFDVQYPAFAVA